MLETLLQSSYFALFLIIALGFILGRIQIKGLSLDVSAVIFIALLFGHFGVIIPKELGNFGLVLFIFTIGIQAGPGFFDSFRSKGKTLIILTLLIVGSASLTGLILKYVVGIDTPSLVGLIAGALTSTPGLAVAIDSTHSSSASEIVAQRPYRRSQGTRSTAKREISPVAYGDFPYHPRQYIRKNTGPVTTSFHDGSRHFPYKT